MRLTQRDITGIPFCQNAGYLEMLEKLATYEDAEEQGLLVRLPCKVGTAIWRVWCGKINRYVVVEVDAQDHVKLRFLIECLPYLRFYWDDEYGKTVFLSRAEAEAALKGESADV